jgi:hypothetical protein
MLMTQVAWLGLWAATFTAATGAAALSELEATAVVSLESLRMLEAVTLKPARWVHQAEAVGIPGPEFISGSGSGDYGSETVVAPASEPSSSSSSSATIAFINSRVPDNVLDRLAQDVLEAAAAEAENRDAHSEASTKADRSASASASSSRDDATVTFPPATTAPTPTSSPTLTPTPTLTPSQDDSSSDKAFKLRVILIGVAVALVVLIMVALVVIAWIRNPGRRRRSTSASIESLVLSPLDNNRQAPLATSSAYNII